MTSARILCATLVAMLPVFTAASLAQNCVLSGKIIDQSGLILPEATITATSSGSGSSITTSDASGRYCFQNLRPREYEVSGALPGFEKVSVATTVGENSVFDFACGHTLECRNRHGVRRL